MAIKSFSYKENNEQHKKAVEYLEAQPNQSQFLINLLIDTMEGNSKYNLKEQVREIVNEIMAQQRLSRSGNIRYVEKQS